MVQGAIQPNELLASGIIINDYDYIKDHGETFYERNLRKYKGSYSIDFGTYMDGL